MSFAWLAKPVILRSKAILSYTKVREADKDHREKIMAGSTVKNIIIGILALNFVVIFHEFGHFTACKLFGVRVNTFSIGFPPVLASVKLGQTNFEIGALPLGGYVSPDPHDVHELPYVKKMIMVLAGILANFLLAFLILFILARRTTTRPIPVVDSVTPDSPASRAGIQPDDRYVALNGVEIDEENIPGFLQTVLASPGQEITLTLERNGQQLEVPVKIDENNPLYGKGIGRLGTPLKTESVPKPTLWKAITQTRESFSGLFSQMGPAMAALMQPKNKSGNGVIGPIGIMSLLGKSLGYGFATFLYFVAIISFNIGVFNLLPIPLLDGGTAAYYTLEALTGSKLPPALATLIYLIFMALLIGLMIRLTIGDLRQLRRK